MTERARSELATRLATVRRQVEELGLDPETVDLAIDAARRAE